MPARRKGRAAERFEADGASLALGAISKTAFPLVVRKSFMKLVPSLLSEAVIVAAIGLVGTCANALPSLDPYNVVWTTPSTDSRGSMPLGNGDIGLNVWVEAGGDLVFYVSKTDAWGDDINGSYGLPKVGRVRVKLDPNPFVAGAPFEQTLSLIDGSIRIQAGLPGSHVTLKVWVDANNPEIHIDGTSALPERVQAIIDTYRTQPSHLKADIIFPAQAASVAWCYQNTNKVQPQLTNRTFGAEIAGDDFKSVSDNTLQSIADQTGFQIRITPLTAISESPNAWKAQADALAGRLARIKNKAAFVKHASWWHDFWNRSWIVVTGTPEAQTITEEYARQRFVTACAGRGSYPIKFNGSIFTTDYTVTHNNKGVKTTEDVDADYRTWGGQYWFQNTRAMYWPLLASGDFEMMQPLFNMYRNKLRDAETQVKANYGHSGAYFAETNPFWSALPNILPDATPSWTLQYFTPILELSAMMLDYFDYTDDKAFARNTLLPVADDGVAFFDAHFKKGLDGKLDLTPDNAIETYWGASNPAPDIAGLHYVLSRLLAMPPDLTTTQERAEWSRVLAETPELPMGTSTTGAKVLLPFKGATLASHRSNGENPELYAVYPFRLYGLGKPDLQLARDTFDVRQAKGTGCWLQDPIHAAYLGNTELARQDVVKNFSLFESDSQERFPTFWGASHDYTPDEDNGGNGMLGLELMLVQAEGNKILMIPAWPTDWNASFKLHAPYNTTIVGEVANGKILSLTVTPGSRSKDIYLASADGTVVPLNAHNAK